jgi:hypothetical protein
MSFVLKPAQKTPTAATLPRAARSSRLSARRVLRQILAQPGGYRGSMGMRATGAAYAVAMVGVVVAVDVLFFRGHVWERLATNVGIVLVFVAFYFRFLRHG